MNSIHSEKTYIFPGIKKNIRPCLIVLLLVVVGYWQVSLFTYALKWDTIDVVLPLRYFFSETIRSGSFPFWNPYQQTGTPFFADLQAPVYNPELLITSLLGGYGVRAMHVLFIFYLGIAAIGMYRLSGYFTKSRNASLLAALSYVFSGYVVAHGQHFFLLVGAAWIPFVMLSYIELNQEREWSSVPKAGIFVFLLVTGAYQALSIVMLYLLVLIFIYFIIKAIIEKKTSIIKRLLALNLLFALTVLVLCLPLVVSTLEIIHSVTRFEEGVSLSKSLSFAQPFTTLLSFLIPFATVKNSEFFGNADLSFINHYFGIIPLLFFILSMPRKHKALEYLILVFGLLIFSMSFDHLPVREFFYNNVPLMDLFVAPAYLRIFGLLSFILIASGYFAYLEKNMAAAKNKTIIAGTVLLMVLLALIGFSISKLTTSDFRGLFNSNNVEEFLNNLSFYQNILIQAFIHFLILTGLIAVLAYYKRLKQPVSLIIILFIAEIIVAAQLNMSSTVVDMQHQPRNMQKDLNLCPEGFPIPINDKVIFNDQQHAFFSPFWRNTYVFTKQVSFDAFSSFELKTYSKLDDDYPNLKNAVLNNHLFYFSDMIRSLDELDDNTIDMSASPGCLYLSKPDCQMLSGKSARTDSTDMIQMLSFSPNRVIVRTKTANDQFFTMLQTQFRGWHVFVDDESVPVYVSNFNYRTIYLPEGDHIVRYEYKNNNVLVSYIIANVFLIICALSLTGYGLYRKNARARLHIWIPSALFVAIVILLVRNFSAGHEDQTTYQYYDARYVKENAILKVVEDFEATGAGEDSSTVYSGNRSYVVHPDTEFLPIVELVQRNNEIKEGTLVVNAYVYAGDYFKALIVSEINNEWHAGKIEKQLESINDWNRILYIRRIPKLKEGETIKVYLWNNDQFEFNLDHISVCLYE